MAPSSFRAIVRCVVRETVSANRIAVIGIAADRRRTSGDVSKNAIMDGFIARIRLAPGTTSM
jgi:hypothetical protein